MTNPVMTVAAECTYSVGDSDERQTCNESILDLTPFQRTVIKRQVG